MGDPYSALTIAKWFIAWAEAEDDELSNLKLQKLLYYAQGHYLARYGRPLFKDELQAWSHGPVVPEVYHVFKESGSAPIVLDVNDPFTWDRVTDEDAEFLGEVWNTYGGFSAGRLRGMTHEEPPWKESFRTNGERGAVISSRPLERFFRQFVPAE